MIKVFVGAVIGRWSALSKDEKKQKSRQMWTCSCSCGSIRSVDQYNLLYGTSKSCGCLASEITAKRNFSHGQSGSITYTRWSSMWARCANKNTIAFDAYKSRTPPLEWLSFETFLTDMGECPNGFSLERVNNSKPYGKENCKWVPLSQQAKNRSTVTKVLVGGTEMSLKEACRHLGLIYTTAIHRIKKQGIPVSAALGGVASFIKKG